MLDGFIDKLGDVMFDVAVFVLRAAAVVLVVRVASWLLGVQDLLVVTLKGLKILFLGE